VASARRRWQRAGARPGRHRSGRGRRGARDASPVDGPDGGLEAHRGVIYSGKTCNASTSTPRGNPVTWVDDQGHWSGNHGATGWADATCSCTPACESTCDASATGGIEDSGLIQYANFHVTDVGTGGGHAYQADGDTAGASCEAGPRVRCARVHPPAVLRSEVRHRRPWAPRSSSVPATPATHTPRSGRSRVRVAPSSR